MKPAFLMEIKNTIYVIIERGFEYLLDIWGTTLGDYLDQVQCDCHEHDRDRPEADFDDERRQERDE
jgi:hypothetical protein